MILAFDLVITVVYQSRLLFNETGFFFTTVTDPKHVPLSTDFNLRGKKVIWCYKSGEYGECSIDSSEVVRN